MTSSIRTATRADVPRLVEMGVRFLTEQPFPFGAPNPARMERTAQALIDGTGEASVMFVAEKDSVLVGMLGMALIHNWMTGDLTASELCWWVEPEHRGGTGLALLARTRAWASDHGATVLQMIAPTEDIAALYERLGFVKLETHYARAL